MCVHLYVWGKNASADWNSHHILKQCNKHSTTAFWRWTFLLSKSPTLLSCSFINSLSFTKVWLYWSAARGLCNRMHCSLQPLLKPYFFTFILMQQDNVFSVQNSKKLNTTCCTQQKHLRYLVYHFIHVFSQFCSKTSAILSNLRNMTRIQYYVFVGLDSAWLHVFVQWLTHCWIWQGQRD